MALPVTAPEDGARKPKGADGKAEDDGDIIEMCLKYV